MTIDLAQVRIVPPDNDDGMVVTRVYSADMALMGQAVAGDPIAVPPGMGYLANALAMNGGPVGLPVRFDVPEGGGPMDVRLDPRNGSKLPTPSDAPEPSIFSRGMAAIERIASPVFTGTVFSHENPRSGEPSAPPFKLVTATMDVGRSRGSDGRVIGPFLPVDGANRDLGVHIISGPQPPGPTGGRCWYLIFQGPNHCIRCAVVPFDVQEGCRRPPNLKWSEARTPGFFLPVFEFDDPATNALTSALRYERSPLARPIANKTIAELAESAMARKIHSPLAAALGGLVLLQEASDRLLEIEQWTANLFEWFPWLPDSLPLRVELLARLGRHEEARGLLRQLPERGPPWTFKALRILVDRMAFYQSIEKECSDEQHNAMQRCQSLLAITHPASVFCIFEMPD